MNNISETTPTGPYAGLSQDSFDQLMRRQAEVLPSPYEGATAHRFDPELPDGPENLVHLIVLPLDAGSVSLTKERGNRWQLYFDLEDGRALGVSDARDLIEQLRAAANRAESLNIADAS